jgi:two-component system CheB/CheR fusion protein
VTKSIGNRKSGTEKSTGKKQAKPNSPAKKAAKPFPVAGIGASAGGVEAVSLLIKSLPADLGMAYVIIQHLSPNHESILPEIFQKKTKMPVHKVEDQMELEANNIYVIPPDAVMSIVDGHLALSAREVSGPNYVIDYFFNELSSVYQNKAIGIILSGTGNDGTSGMQSIKAEGGITFAQDESAMFDGMPQSAISSGYVDFVLSPQDIARELTALVKLPYSTFSPEKIIATNEAELRRIHVILHNKHSVDFSNYKQTTINRRIIRRMTLNRCRNLDEYIQLLMEKPDEVAQLYRDLLINVTAFFREPELYQSLSKKIFPSLLKNRRTSDPIRIWIPACSTGEEACTIAICLLEFLGDKATTIPVQIFATDLSDAAIEKARSGIYPRSVFENVAPQRLEKYFVKIDGHYQVIKPVRDICIFATHNLLKDPPFSRLDMISCQNVMIYLESAAQKRILNAFHYALKPTGFLLLGKSETIGSSTELFEQIEKEFKVYTRKISTTNPQFDFSSRFSSSLSDIEAGDKKIIARADAEPDIDKEIDRVLLSRYVPASVVINKDMQIIRFHGAMSGYLQPASGKASFHLLKMVRDEVLFDLRTLIIKAKKEGRPVKKDNIQQADGGPEISLEVVPLTTLKEAYFLILFKEGVAQRETEGQKAPEQKSRDAKTVRIQMLEQELRDGREHMKMMSEEFEATREELQSANEEVLSSNEELQSINEELETSKEELQSSNEELTTINEELQHRNTDLREAVEYTKAIVQTIREPLLVLSSDMRIRTANKAFYSTFRLSPDETEGHYFHEIGNGMFNIAELKKHLLQVIASNMSFQNVELKAKLQSAGKRTLMYSAMRMAQEESKNNRILLSVEDITQRKKTDETLKENEERFRLLVQNAFDVLAILSKDGTIQFISESLENILGYKPAERMGMNIFEHTIVHADDTTLEKKMLKDCITQPHTNIKSEFRMMHKKGHYVIMEAVGVNLLDNPRVHGIVVNYRDVTERRLLEKQKEEFLAIASHELKTPVTSIKGYTEILIDNFEDANDSSSVALVKKLDKQVDRLTDLIKDLLDVTRITEGQLQLRKSTFDINELINDISEELKYNIGRHELITELKPVKKIFADKERIRQVLLNLISNAVKYSPDADKVIVSTNDNRRHLKVCITDNGIGMSEEMKKKVFERFFRVNDNAVNTFPGLGLGLFIAAEIVKKHNGQITVESEKNKGSVFCFTLPLKDS